MNNKILGIIACAMANAIPAQAADTKWMMPLDKALAAPEVKTKLDGSVKFYFAGQPTPAVVRHIVTNKTSQKADSVEKPAEDVCNRAFLSNLISLEKHAKRMGANAVINIVSNYRNIENPSATEFECHIGYWMGGVALKGDFVVIENK